MSEQKTILIVEDGEENVIFLAQILEDHGFRFRIARNGKEAMATLAEARPDLVLLDIMMPRKSGIHVYNEMKSQPGLAKIPIVFVTGASAATGVDIRTGEEAPRESYGDELARKLGSALHDQMKNLKPDALLEKPIDPQLVIRTINELL